MRFFKILIFILCALNILPIATINPETLIEISNSVIKKCKCNEGSALLDNRCVAYQNPIPIWDSREEIRTVVNISDFYGTEVKPVECHHGSSKIELTLNEFILYSTGLLFNSAIVSSHEISDYCLDHIIKDGQLTITAQACQLNPQIHWCCPSNQIKINYDCVEIDELPNLNGIPLAGGFVWESFNETIGKIKCPENLLYKKVPLVPPDSFPNLGASLVGYPLGSKLIYIFSTINQHIFIPNGGFCISYDEPKTTNYYAEFCIPDPKEEHVNWCKNSTCIRKCCPPGKAYDINYRICLSHPYNFTYTFDNNVIPANLQAVYGGPFCEEYYFLNNDLTTPVLNMNGQLSFQDQNVISTDYCIDGFVNVTNANHTTYDSAIVCFRNREQPCEWRWIAGSVLLGISCMFYALTIIIYMLIRELRQKISGKCLISEVSSLFITYLVLIILQNSTSEYGPVCNIPGTVVHISILASFFWLNVMCYDMWKTITSDVPVAANRIRGAPRSQKRFLFYSLYAWGIPILIGIIRVGIDQVPIGDYTFLPRTTLGKGQCFFSDKDRFAKWIYLYAPIAIILFVNTIFFILVAKSIIEVKKKTQKTMQMINAESPSHQQKKGIRNRDKTILYLKLFLVMGLSWVMEIIMWVAVDEMDCRFWILDLVNMSQGVFIFIIFVCKKSTLNLVKQMYAPETTQSISTTPVTRVKLRTLEVAK